MPFNITWMMQFPLLSEVFNPAIICYLLDTLNAKNRLGIFPEGVSHNRPEMLPLKVGATIMALGAMANNPSLNVKIVPCGLHYFNPHRFRSRAVIEFGNPISIESGLVSLYKQGGDAKRKACTELLEVSPASLKNVTVTAPDMTH